MAELKESKAFYFYFILYFVFYQVNNFNNDPKFQYKTLWQFKAKKKSLINFYFKMKRVASPGSMHDTGCLGLVHWDDPEGWYGVTIIKIIADNKS